MSWFLATTAPSRELKSSRVLSHFAFPNHVFKHQVLEPRQGRLVERLVPAFPRYIFLFFVDETQLLLQTLWHYACLIDFVRVSGQAAVVDASLDRLLKMSLADDVLPVDNEIGARFKFGDKVQVVTGNHAAFGCSGIYQYTVRPGRVCILSPWLGQLAPVELNESDIELVSRINHNNKRRKRRSRRGRRDRYISPPTQSRLITASA